MMALSSVLRRWRPSILSHLSTKPSLSSSIVGRQPKIGPLYALVQSRWIRRAPGTPELQYEPPDFTHFTDGTFKPETNHRVEYVTIFWDPENVKPGSRWYPVPEAIEWMREQYKDRLKQLYGDVPYEVMAVVIWAGPAVLLERCPNLRERLGKNILFIEYKTSGKKNEADEYLYWSWQKNHVYNLKNGLPSHFLLVMEDGYCKPLVQPGSPYYPNDIVVVSAKDLAKVYFVLPSFDYLELREHARSCFHQWMVQKYNELPTEDHFFVVRKHVA